MQLAWVLFCFGQVEETWLWVCLLSLDFGLHHFTQKATRSLFSYSIKINTLLFKSLYTVSIFFTFSHSAPFTVNSPMLILHMPLDFRLTGLWHLWRKRMNHVRAAKLNGATSFHFANSNNKSTCPAKWMTFGGSGGWSLFVAEALQNISDWVIIWQYINFFCNIWWLLISHWLFSVCFRC